MLGMPLTSLYFAVTGIAIFSLGILLPIIFRNRTSHVEAKGLIPSGNRPFTVLIPAYLEVSSIGPTTRRLREELTSYAPAGSRVLVVASDLETAIAAQKAGAEVLQTPREGKSSAINRGVAVSEGSIVVVTDANCQIQPPNWPELLIQDLEHSHLVSASKHESGSPETAYWKYEQFLNKHEHSRATETLALVGEFLAFRSEDFSSIPAEGADDTSIAISFHSRGKRTVIDSRISASEPTPTFRDNIERRIRITSQLADTLAHNFGYLLKTPLGRKFLLHKGYRTTIGTIGFWLMIGALVFSGNFKMAVIVPTILAVCVAIYATRPKLIPNWVHAASTAISLQFVPLMSVPRVLRNMFIGRETGWEKVAR